jgi:hypothetical protein
MKERSSTMDMLGVYIDKGATVAYPRRQSSDVWIATGVVVDVDRSADKVKLIGGTGQRGEPLGKRPRWVHGRARLVVTRGSMAQTLLSAE